MSNTIYFPIMCCDQEMIEIWGDGERLATFCSKCGKKWEPKEEGIKFGKPFVVKLEGFLTDEQMTAIRDIVKNGLNKIINDLEQDTIFGANVVVDPSMPKNEVKLIGSDGKEVRIINLEDGKKEN